MKAILTLNIGSSTVKASLRDADIDEDAPIWGSSVDMHDKAEPAITAVIRSACETGAEIIAVGHRIVHGGAKFAGPVLIDGSVLSELEALIPLAPGHQPYNLDGVKIARAALPDTAQIACFDTAFHRTMPRIERVFALPRRYAEKGVVRYGFHGLSYAYIASILPDLLGPAAGDRIIVAHLGSGASLCAMRGGRSAATTMGFTALDGPPMATRSGSIDPGVILYLLQEEAMTPSALSDLLYNKAGLLGVSGLSGDMRVLLASDDPRAKEAIDCFAYRVAREIGSLAAAVGGLDTVVFTGGIGENAAPVRARICEHISWLGFSLNMDANAANAAKALCISTLASQISVWVVHTDEEREIAREARRLIATTH
ncbi:MAG: acetate/propionate family kinase [Amphiplicatus sp.]